MLLKDLFDISVKNFTYMNPEIPKGNQYKSKGSCDIVVENEKEIIIVEMQNQKIKNFAKRSMIYISGVYKEEWQKHDKNYENIRPITLCWLLNYKYGKKELQIYEMLERELHEKFGDGIKIEICTIDQLQEEKYKRLFKAKREEELEDMKDDPKYKDIVRQIKKYNMDEEEY